MKDLAIVDPKDFGLEENQVMTIEQAFVPKIAERDGLQKVYELLILKEITKESCNEAGDLRRKLVKVRTGIADIHKTQKAFFLRAGQFVDAWKNKETVPVEQMEEKLSEMEKHFEKLEAERIAKIETDRKIELSQYSDIIPYGMGTMDESVYQNYIVGVKLSYEARIKAEQEAESERLRLIEVEKETARLKAIEDERISLENEALKAEALKKEKELEAERKRQADELAKQKAEAETKQREIEETARKEREAIEEKNRIERAKAEAERKRLENELFAKQQAELKAKQEAERLEKARIAIEAKEAKAPDKERLKIWVDSMVIKGLPAEKMSPDSIKIANEIFAKFAAFKVWAKSQIESI